MNPTELIQELEETVEVYISTIEDLPDSLFLKSMNGWSPRDVTAHLIGWNQLTIEGCDQITRGKRPNYFDDADNDYSNINAQSVKTYASKNKVNLLVELEDSFKDLKSFLRSLSYQNWVKDYGVRYADWVITVHNTVLALREDYQSHQQEIETWAKVQKIAKNRQ